MKKITSNLSTVTKVLMIALLMTGVSVDSFAQKDKKAKKEKVIKKPASAGHAATDNFVNSSFDVYERNQKLSNKLSDAAGNVADAGKVKNDLEAQLKEITGLLGKSKDVLAKAKAITPKTNAMKAGKAANAAVKVLNATQKAIPAQLDQIKAQEAKK
ncbi:MAG: hypothetical protein COB15_14925 [Flavobacteriales bacterium]|nr:MAG: hypothetical protein COB15_14925 [Flavobacteriales bacterium]